MFFMTMKRTHKKMTETYNNPDYDEDCNRPPDSSSPASRASPASPASPAFPSSAPAPEPPAPESPITASSSQPAQPFLPFFPHISIEEQKKILLECAKTLKEQSPPSSKHPYLHFFNGSADKKAIKTEIGRVIPIYREPQYVPTSPMLVRTYSTVGGI